jgi:hypothetical protein
LYDNSILSRSDVQDNKEAIQGKHKHISRAHVCQSIPFFIIHSAKQPRNNICT